MVRRSFNRRLGLAIGLALAGVIAVISLTFEDNKGNAGQDHVGSGRDTGHGMDGITGSPIDLGPTDSTKPEPQHLGAEPKTPEPRSSQIPPVDAYGELETLMQRERLDVASGMIERIRLVRADFKYPLLRVVESLAKDPANGAGDPIVVKRLVMVADHLLVSKPEEALRTGGEFQILGEVAPGSDAWRVSIPAESTEDMSKALAKLERLVEVAEPDYLVFHHQTIPNDTSFGDLWGMRNTGQTGGKPGADVKATLAWQHRTGGGNIVVAVIDSGVDYLHPDLMSNIYQNSSETQDGVDSDGNGYVDDIRGWDFHGNDNDPMDDHFHGTHVAGTVGARGNNTLGVAGVIWNVKILPLKFLSASGSGTTSDAIAAVRYSADNGARISCNSWGGGGYSRLLEDAIRHAGDMNSLFVAAAGNSSSNNDVSPSYPASYDLGNIISVAATDHNDEIAWFSNVGATKVHIAAPGVGITSTFPRAITSAMAEYGLPANYARISGTSMATPHVAGAAALLLDSDPSQTTAQLRNRILQRADFLVGLTGLVSTSARLNVASLVDPSWVPTPAEPLLGQIEWREVAGQSDGDGVAGAGDQMEFIADITNRGGIDANEVVLSAMVVSGPATLISPAVATLGTLKAYAGIPARRLAVIAVNQGAQDLQQIVVRLEISWQGGTPTRHEITISVARLSQLQASREVDFSIGEMIRGPIANSVFMVSPSAWRVIEVSTATGMVSRYADLDMSNLNNDGKPRRAGGLATNMEGTLLFAALTGTRQIQVFSLPQLASLRTLSVDHEPHSLAMDARGRLFTTSMDYWGPLREVDVTDGRTLVSRNISNTGRQVYQAAQLKTDSSRQRLFLAETDLHVTGGPGYVYEWNVSGLTVDLPVKHPNVTINLKDFDIDEPNQSLFTMHGGIYGVQVTSLTSGVYGEIWPLRSPYGAAVDVPPGKDHIFAGSGASYPGIIRRFQKVTGMDLGAYEVQPPSSNAKLVSRGLVATENDRVLYASYSLTGNSTSGIDGIRYFLNLAGSSVLDVTLPPPSLLPAQPMLAKVDFSDFAGNGDSLPNPGEAIHLAPHVRNIGGAPTPAGVMEITSLDARVTITGTSSWIVPAIAGQTTLMLPEVGVQIGAAVPDDTAVDFRFRLILTGGSIHEFTHRLTVRVPQTPAGTSPFSFSDLQFSGMASHPHLNEVYLIDSRNLRVVVLDTTYGMISRVVAIPAENPIFNGMLARFGEPAVSADGTLLAVAGNQTRKVFVFSLPEIRLVASHATTFMPTNVAFDSLNRLHVTGTNPIAGTTLHTLRMDAVTGGGAIGYGINVVGSPLRASKDGSLVGRLESGALKIYDGNAPGIPALVHDISLPANELSDFEIDPIAGKAYLIVRNGAVSVRNLSDGQETASWSLNNPNWGSAVRLCPNGELVAASDYWYGGGIRRYFPTGATLQDVVLTDYQNYSGGNAGSVVPRGLAVTPNGRIVFLANRVADSRSTSVDGYEYTVGILGVPVVLAEPGSEALKMEGFQLLDPSPANNNGYAEPGERIVLVPTLRNTSFNLLRNLSLSFVSSNPAVVPVSPLSGNVTALNVGVAVQLDGGLAVQVGSGVKDGESLGLSLHVTHDSGSQIFPLELYAMKTLRADVEINFSVGSLLADKTRNVVYVSDTSNNRVLAIDSESGTVIAACNLAGLIRNNQSSGFADGSMALSKDGQQLVVALFESSRVQVLSTTNLALIDVIQMDIKPGSVAFGDNGRIYATSGATTGRMREINPATGNISTVGTKNYAISCRLLTSSDHRDLYTYELDGHGNLPIDSYRVDDGTPPGMSRTHFYRRTGFGGQIVLDEERKRFVVARGAAFGLQQTHMDHGVTEAVWPFPSNAHGRACAYLPGSNFVYGGNSEQNSLIRRFDRQSGRPLADYPIAAPGVTSMYFHLLDRGIVVTPNQRVLFATMDQPVPSIASRRFLGLIGHSTLDMTQPLARPKVDAGSDRTVKLSKPLTFEPLLELPPGSGTATAAWSQASGPGTVVFSTNGSTTVANFSQPGRYQLRFAATVGGVTSSDAVWVDVQPDDPWINLSAISSKAMRHPGLQGGFILSREGDTSSPLTIQLSHGGTAVAGTDYTALPASVVMSAGIRTMTVPLVILAGNGSGSVIVSVLPGTAYEPGAASTASVDIVPTTLTNWLAAAQEARPDLDLSATGDANSNGLKNQMEYLLAQNPINPAPGNPLAIAVGSNPHSVTASFRALKNPIGAELMVEFSNNLNNWNTQWQEMPAVEVTGREDHGDGSETITVTFSPAAAAEPKGFLRLRGDMTGE